MYATIRTGDPSRVTRATEVAAGMGFDGLVVRIPHTEYPLEIADRASERTPEDFAVVPAIEIDPASPEAASGLVGTYREQCDLLVLRGGTPAVNRFAVEHSKVDVLAAPMADRGDINHVLARSAADNAVCLEYTLRPVIRNHGGGRVRSLQGLRKLHELRQAAEAPFVVTAGARTPRDLRAHRELRALGEVIDIGAETVMQGLRKWERIVKHNRRRRSDRFIEPGVSRGPYEDSEL